MKKASIYFICHVAPNRDNGRKPNGERNSSRKRVRVPNGQRRGTERKVEQTVDKAFEGAEDVVTGKGNNNNEKGGATNKYKFTREF